MKSFNYIQFTRPIKDRERSKGQAVLEYVVIAGLIMAILIVFTVQAMPSIRDEIVEFRNKGIDRVLGVQR